MHRAAEEKVIGRAAARNARWVGPGRKKLIAFHHQEGAGGSALKGYYLILSKVALAIVYQEGPVGRL